MTMKRERIFEVPLEVYPFSKGQDKWMDVNMGKSTITVHYLDEGDPDAPVIVFFHGNPTWSLLYRNLIPPLSKIYRCICVDLPGYGYSERPLRAVYDYRPETHSALMEMIVEALGLRDMTFVVQDWGGPIGVGLAGRRPELVSKLVIGNTWIFPVDEDSSFHKESGFDVPRMFSKEFMGGRAKYFDVVEENFFLVTVSDVIRDGLKRRGCDQNLIEAVVAAYNEPWKHPEWRYPTWLAPSLIAGEEGKEYITEVEAGLSKLKDKPVLLPWGLLDPICGVALRDYIVQRGYFPYHTLLDLPESHHFYQEDSPKEVLKAMQIFMAA